VVEGWSNKGQGFRSSLNVSSLHRIESMTDLPVTVAILFEHTMEEFQFCWETSLVAGCSSCVPWWIEQNAYWSGGGVTQY